MEVMVPVRLIYLMLIFLKMPSCDSKSRLDHIRLPSNQRVKYMPMDYKVICQLNSYFVINNIYYYVNQFSPGLFFC